MRFPTGKGFAVLLAVISLASAALFFVHRWRMPLPASRHAGLLDAQFYWTLVASGVVFLLAQLVLAAFVWKFQAQTVKSSKPVATGVRVAIVLATIFIAIEIFSAATLGRKAWGSMYPASTSADVVRVQVMGQQFAYYFRYPGADGKFGQIHMDKIDASIGSYFGLDRMKDAAARDDIESATLVLPANRPVELLLDSQDVIHSFYVRELRVQQDMVPGMEIPVRFTPTRVGRYEIVCSQLCGLGHYRMRAYLEVLPESGFQKWLQAHASR